MRLLANPDDVPRDAVRADYEALLDTMRTDQATAGALSPAVGHFLRVTASYGAGLFHCYDHPDLPRTNNDLERRFGLLRYHERRATGRRTVTGGLVLRGAVRVLAVLTSDQSPAACELRPTDRAAWRDLRRHLDARVETRRAQRRFRRDPAGYLAALERQFLK